jgi:hypothetical protein
LIRDQLSVKKRGVGKDIGGMHGINKNIHGMRGIYFEKVVVFMVFGEY